MTDTRILDVVYDTNTAQQLMPRDLDLRLFSTLVAPMNRSLEYNRWTLTLTRLKGFFASGNKTEKLWAAVAALGVGALTFSKDAYVAARDFMQRYISGPAVAAVLATTTFLLFEWRSGSSAFSATNLREKMHGYLRAAVTSASISAAAYLYGHRTGAHTAIFAARVNLQNPIAVGSLVVIGLFAYALKGIVSVRRIMVSTEIDKIMARLMKMRITVDPPPKIENERLRSVEKALTVLHLFPEITPDVAKFLHVLVHAGKNRRIELRYEQHYRGIFAARWKRIAYVGENFKPKELSQSFVAADMLLRVLVYNSYIQPEIETFRKQAIRSTVASAVASYTLTLLSSSVFADALAIFAYTIGVPEFNAQTAAAVGAAGALVCAAILASPTINKTTYDVTVHVEKSNEPTTRVFDPCSTPLGIPRTIPVEAFMINGNRKMIMRLGKVGDAKTIAETDKQIAAFCSAEMPAVKFVEKSTAPAPPAHLNFEIPGEVRDAIEKIAANSDGLLHVTQSVASALDDLNQRLKNIEEDLVQRKAPTVTIVQIQQILQMLPDPDIVKADVPASDNANTQVAPLRIAFDEETAAPAKETVDSATETQIPTYAV